MRSTRLPGKMLADIAGKPLVAWVAERARASGAAEVVVATDHEDIAAAVSALGWRVCVTSPLHETGTDRLAEAVAQLGLPDADIVVNVQGDEPLIAPALIKRVGTLLAKKSGAEISTACHAIHDGESLDNPNVVKVVMDREGYALYFSRSRIPFPREPGAAVYRHAGIYGYRVGFLKRFSRLKASPLEQAEALEQLRALWHGYRIAVAVSETAIPPGVDTPRDLEAVRRMAR